MLHASGLPKFLWREATCHAIWLKNRTPTKALGGQTPYEIAFGKTPDLCSLREWGSDAYVRFEKSNKLSSHVKKVRWVGINMECETVAPPLIPNLGTNG